MNRKGFTLIELLATIVILGIVGGIATYGVINTINASKLKSEKIFVDKLSNLIDDYLDLYLPNEKKEGPYDFKKCINDSCTDNYSVEAIKVYKRNEETKSIESITLKDLVDNGIVTYKELKNPKNKQQCFGTILGNTYNPEIVIYKDTDYVYHYYVDLSDSHTNCDITDENALIDNIPENLVRKLYDDEVNLPNNLKKKYDLN